MTNKLSHFDEEGAARMVDVSAKEETVREAVAEGRIFMQPETLALVLDRKVVKGDVFAVARIAGIMAAKKTPELIPLCHPLSLSSVHIDFEPDKERSCVAAVSRRTSRRETTCDALPTCMGTRR